MCHEDAAIAGLMAGGVPLSEKEAAQLGVHVLAFLGDSVFSTLTREYAVLHIRGKADDMHRFSVGTVNASAQAGSFLKIREMLTDAEESVYRRARNARSTHTPKNMSEGAYHSATGVEALFGYLYISGQFARMYELYFAMVQ